MAAWSDASAGDLRPVEGTSGDESGLGRWATRVTGGSGDRGHAGVREVRWVAQVHGSSVVTVPGPQVDGDGFGRLPPVVPVTLAGTGDALVSAAPSVALAVLTADCASVALGSREGVFAAVHAGWRGLTKGVVQATVGAMRDLGATEVVGALGPCIHAGCYEFSQSDLAEACAVLGERARGATSDGRPALDIPTAVSTAMTACGVNEVPGVGVCTACDGRYFSHRGRGDLGRQALLVWSAPSREETSVPVGL